MKIFCRPAIISICIIMSGLLGVFSSFSLSNGLDTTPEFNDIDKLHANTILPPNRTIWVLDSNTNLIEVQTEFLFNNSRLAVYIQSGHSANVSYIQNIINQSMIFIEKVHSTFGEQILDMDTNDLVYIDFVNLPDISTAGYFFPPNQYTAVNNPESYRFRSCECEQLYINLKIIDLVNEITLRSKILHEYTNLYQFTFDRIEDLWISEGLSTWLEWWSGAADLIEMNVYQQPITTILDGSLSLSYFSSKLEEFGLTSRFFDYLFNVYGISYMIEFLQSDSFSFWGIEEVFGNSFRAIFANWLIEEYSGNIVTLGIGRDSRLPISRLNVNDNTSSNLNLVSNSWVAYNFQNYNFIGRLTINVGRISQQSDYEFIILGKLYNNTWISAFISSQKLLFQFNIPRLRDYSEIILIAYTTDFNSSGISNFNGVLSPIFSGFIRLSFDSLYDFSFTIPNIINNTINLTNTFIPSNLIENVKIHGIVEVLIFIDEMWVVLDSIELFSLDELTFSQSGTYLLIVYLDDNSTGISNRFQVIIVGKTSNVSGFLPIHLFIVFSVLLNSKNRSKKIVQGK